jgi:hypothetical protein
MLYDRTKIEDSITRCLDESYVEITSIGYGPYDNGHILAGLSNGILLAFDTINLDKLFQINVFSPKCPVSSMTFEPTNLVILTCEKTGELAALSFLASRVRYVYIDLGKKKYATIKLD